MLHTFNKSKLEYERVTISKLFKVGIITMCTAIGIGFSIAPRPTINNLSQEEKLIIIRENNEFSESKLIKKIKDLNFKFPHIVLAQAYQETGQFSSVIFKQNNNLFGMKEAKQRATVAIGTSHNHAKYNTWNDSVVDYALYYSTYLYSINTEEEYFQYLNQYAEDPSYTERLKTIIKTNKLKSKF
jgi:uncharacterized FlgJ-related protein